MSATSPATAVLHSGREEITLRLGEDVPEPVEREANKPTVSATNQADPFGTLLYLAEILRVIGGDPEGLLRREVHRRTDEVDRNIGRLLGSIERERQIRKRAEMTANLKGARRDNERTTGKKGETHRKKLQRDFERFLLVGHDPAALLEYLLARDAVTRAEQGRDLRALWKARDDLDRVMWRLAVPAFESAKQKAAAGRVGQIEVSHENVSTGGGSASSTLDDDRQRREGDSSRGTTEEHRGSQLAPATQTSDAQELPLKGRRTSVHQAEREPRGIQDRRPERLDRIPTPHEHERPGPRPRRVRRRRRD